MVWETAQTSIYQSGYNITFADAADITASFFNSADKITSQNGPVAKCVRIERLDLKIVRFLIHVRLEFQLTYYPWDFGQHMTPGQEAAEGLASALAQLPY